jgi:hypothetical protein
MRNDGIVTVTHITLVKLEQKCIFIKHGMQAIVRNNVECIKMT